MVWTLELDHIDLSVRLGLGSGPAAWMGGRDVGESVVVLVERVVATTELGWGYVLETLFIE